MRPDASPHGFEVVACEPSDLGWVLLRQRELASERGVFATEIALDHQFLMSSHVTDSELALAREAIAMRGGEHLRALVGGLGLGYTAREALRSPRVARVEVVELLAPVIGWLEQGLLPLAAELRADPRLAVREGDVYRLLAAAPERRHDLILIDVDHSPDERLGETSASFYGADGLRAARAHLAPGGVLGVWSYAASPVFESTLRGVFGDVHTIAVEFENRVVGGRETNFVYLARCDATRETGAA